MKVNLYNISGDDKDYWMRILVSGQLAEASSVGVRSCCACSFGKTNEFLKKLKNVFSYNHLTSGIMSIWPSIISEGLRNFILLDPFEESKETIDELFKKLKSYDELVPIHICIYSSVEEYNNALLDNCKKTIFSIKKLEKENEN